MPVTRNSSVQHAFKSNYVTFKKSVSEQNTINYDWLAIGEGFWSFKRVLKIRKLLIYNNFRSVRETGLEPGLGTQYN